MLKIVKGDVFEFVVCVKIDPVIIERVVFESKDLNLEHTAELENGIYRVRILGEETKKFPKGFARFDITATFIDGEKLTLKRNDKVEVLEKSSEV